MKAFLFHVSDESKHRRFSFSELERLEADLGKLRRWHSQIAARDFEEQGIRTEAGEMLELCDAELGAFLEEAFKLQEATA